MGCAEPDRRRPAQQFLRAAHLLACTSTRSRPYSMESGASLPPVTQQLSCAGLRIVQVLRTGRLRARLLGSAQSEALGHARELAARQPAVRRLRPWTVHSARTPIRLSVSATRHQRPASAPADWVWAAAILAGAVPPGCHQLLYEATLPELSCIWPSDTTAASLGLGRSG